MCFLHVSAFCSIFVKLSDPIETWLEAVSNHWVVEWLSMEGVEIEVVHFRVHASAYTESLFGVKICAMFSDRITDVGSVELFLESLYKIIIGLFLGAVHGL